MTKLTAVTLSVAVVVITFVLVTLFRIYEQDFIVTNCLSNTAACNTTNQ